MISVREARKGREILDKIIALQPGSPSYVQAIVEMDRFLADNERAMVEAEELQSKFRKAECEIQSIRDVVQGKRNVGDLRHEQFGWSETYEALNHFLHSLRNERDTLARDLEQERVRLAGCGVAALGGTSDSQRVAQGDYGWSPAYEDVLKLRLKYDELDSIFLPPIGTVSILGPNINVQRFDGGGSAPILGRYGLVRLPGEKYPDENEQQSFFDKAVIEYKTTKGTERITANIVHRQVDGSSTTASLADFGVDVAYKGSETVVAASRTIEGVELKNGEVATLTIDKPKEDTSGGVGTPLPWDVKKGLGFAHD